MKKLLQIARELSQNSPAIITGDMGMYAYYQNVVPVGIDMANVSLAEIEKLFPIRTVIEGRVLILNDGTALRLYPKQINESLFVSGIRVQDKPGLAASVLSKIVSAPQKRDFYHLFDLFNDFGPGLSQIAENNGIDAASFFGAITSFNTVENGTTPQTRHCSNFERLKSFIKQQLEKAANVQQS
jgi:hypothetical protein